MGRTRILWGREIGAELESMCERATTRCLICTWSLGPNIRRGPLKPLFDHALHGELTIILNSTFTYGVHADPHSVQVLLEAFGSARVLWHQHAHAKIYLIDNEAIVGSANLSTGALCGGAPELALHTTDQHLLRDIQCRFEEIKIDAYPITQRHVTAMHKFLQSQSKTQRPILRFAPPSTSVVQDVPVLPPSWPVPLNLHSLTPLPVAPRLLRESIVKFADAMDGMQSFRRPTAKYLAHERNYKVAAAHNAQGLLGPRSSRGSSPREFVRILDHEIVRGLFRMDRSQKPKRNNMVASNQRSGSDWNRDVFRLERDPQLAGRLRRALRTMLYSQGDEKQRLERYYRFVESAGFTSGQWIWYTYSLCVCRPDRHVFIKPKLFEQFFGKRLGLADQKFNRRCSADVYSKGRRAVLSLGVSLREMEPLDFIDLQSFIWVVTKYPE